MAAKNKYEELLKEGYTSQEIHSVFQKFILAETAAREKRRALRQSISGSALSLLKTLFFKKPKNPV